MTYYFEKEKLIIDRPANLNKYSLERLHAIPPKNIAINLYPSGIADFRDDFLLDLTKEQLLFINANIISLFPLDVIEKLLLLHKDETDNEEIVTRHYSEKKQKYIEKVSYVNGNAVRIANAIELHKDRDIILKEMNNLRKMDINQYEVNGYVPLKLVSARLQDIYSKAYMSDNTLLKYMDITPVDMSLNHEDFFNGEKFVNKQDVINFLNTHLTTSQPPLTEIPCLITKSGLIQYPVKNRIDKLEKKEKKYGEYMTIIEYENEKFYIQTEVEMLLALNTVSVQGR